MLDVVGLCWNGLATHVGCCWTMLDDVGGSLTSVKNVACFWVLLEWFGHSAPQNHVRANLICFASGANVSYKIEGKQQEKNQRYETFSSDEEENDNFSFDSICGKPCIGALILRTRPSIGGLIFPYRRYVISVVSCFLYHCVMIVSYEFLIFRVRVNETLYE